MATWHRVFADSEGLNGTTSTAPTNLLIATVAMSATIDADAAKERGFPRWRLAAKGLFGEEIIVSTTKHLRYLFQ